MLEEGEIDELEDFNLTTNLTVNSTNSTSPLNNKSQLSPASDHSTSSKSSYKRKNRQKNQNNKRKKFESHEDKDERFTSSILTTTPPVTMPQNNAPISLFDLFKQSQQVDKDQSSYLNPIITEKENSVPTTQIKKSQPLLSLPVEFKETKRKTLLEEPDESEMTVSVESIEKKMEKKRKYAEIQKERQKKEAEKQQQIIEKREKILCQFFLAGRCTKGDKCQFSHQAPKKYELCKFYANGFCSKLDKCFFMHSDFPCKFFHRGQCTQGEKCRFSHEPITNPQLQEAFDKYLAEISQETPLKPSLLGTPSSGLLPTPEPLPLMNLTLKTDVDERNFPTGDVDLRAFNSLVEFDRLKKEVIEKIMKNLSSENSQNSEMPKTVLAELLVKLLNTDNIELAKTLTLDALSALLTTLSTQNSHVENFVPEDVKNEHVEEDDENKFDLQIDEIKDEIDECAYIEGHCGEFPWRVFEVEIEPSSLWDNPPKENNLDPDQESDPRIKYYANRSNCLNLTNYHLKLQKENIKIEPMSNASPVYTEPVKPKIEPVQMVQPIQPQVQSKPVRVDPRLAARSAQQSSPPPSTQPSAYQQQQDTKIDLLNRPIKDQSLLSSLPDIQLPKDLKNTLLNMNYPSPDSNTSTSAKLSIEDYKRKLQRPNTNSSSNLSSLSIKSEERFNYNSNISETFNSSSSSSNETKSSLPNIPSYSINIQAPQSLHELLRNFQS
ncbi:unnamed protein product [Brachionus calyciflorus]|uniref:C3H1-type domain-containing protein n=1 Tax=Brachionus calyciflorus TaxID=104777 RepID=A0A814BAW5_9BILA|nr:unnamed protein product [Brachionus calyciflorus]